MKKLLLAALAFAGLGSVGVVTAEDVVVISKAESETVPASAEKQKATLPRFAENQIIRITRNTGSDMRGFYLNNYSPLYDMRRIEAAKRHTFRNRKR